MIITVPHRYGVRGGTAANLATVNETPLVRELVFETDTLKFKLGDGVTPWLSLDYVGNGDITLTPDGVPNPLATYLVDEAGNFLTDPDGNFLISEGPSTTNLPEGTNLYFTEARARTAAVADAITDGVTNIAPSQNAVFDALALRQPIDQTLTALAANDWVANTVPIGGNGNTVSLLAMAANTFLARSSAGAVDAKAITDVALAALANMSTGSLTPTVVGTTSAGVGTYTTQAGSYIRFGTLVLFKLSVVITAHTGTGNMRIGGLPFTSMADANVPVSLHSVNNITLTAGNTLTAAVLANSTEIQLGQSPTGGGAFAGVPMDTAFGLQIAGFYFTN